MLVANSNISNDVKFSYIHYLKNPKLWISFALVSFTIYVIIDTTTTGNVKAVLINFLEYFGNLGVWGPILLSFVYCCATVLLLPGLFFLTLGAGYIFTSIHNGNQFVGTMICFTAVYIGASSGALLVFLLVRFLIQDTALNMSKRYKLWNAIKKAIEKNGFKVVVLLRLNPIIPFNVLNYLLGTSSIKFKDYAAGMIGMIPGTLLVSFIGSTLGTLNADNTPGATNDQDSFDVIKLVMTIVGVSASILLVCIITFYARREMKEYVETDDTVETTSDDSRIVSPCYIKIEE